MTEPLEPAKPPADRIYGTPLSLQRIEAIRGQIAALSKGLPVIIVTGNDLVSDKKLKLVGMVGSEKAMSPVDWSQAGGRLKDIFMRHVDSDAAGKFMTGVPIKGITPDAQYEEMARLIIGGESEFAWRAEQKHSRVPAAGLIGIPDQNFSLNEKVSLFTGIPQHEFVDLPGTAGDMYAAIMLHEARHISQMKDPFPERILRNEIDADCGMREGLGEVGAVRPDFNPSFPDFFNTLREVSGIRGLETEVHRTMFPVIDVSFYGGLKEIGERLTGKLPSHATHFATDTESCSQGVDDKGISKLAAQQRVGALVNTLVGIEEHKNTLEAIKSRQRAGDTSQADKDLNYFLETEGPAGIFKLHDMGAKAVIDDAGKKYNAFRVLDDAKLFPEGSEEQAHIGRVAGFLRRYAPNYLEDADSAAYRERLRGTVEIVKSGPMSPLPSVDDPTPENEKAKQGIKNLLAPIMKQ